MKLQFTTLRLAVCFVVLSAASGWLAAAGRYSHTEKQKEAVESGDKKDLPESIRSLGTKDGVPPDLQSARNIAKKKKRFTVNIYHPLPKSEMAKVASSNTGASAGVTIVGSKTLDADTSTANSIDMLMKTIHSNILKRKMYFRHSKVSRINQYKYCTYPMGPLIILIGPDGEDAAKFNYWRDSLDFYNQVTKSMYTWVEAKYLKGEVEWAYHGARALEDVGEAYREKDKMLKLIADVKAAYIELKGADAVAAEDANEDAADKDETPEETADAPEDDDEAGETADSAAPDGKNEDGQTIGSDAEKTTPALGTSEGELANPAHPQWKQAAAKLLNAGTLEKNDAKDMALRYYKEIVRDWPASPQAVEAQKRIDSLEKK
ncbi:MAG: hypothetical protein ABIH86_02290 [Planctomycetota bacterium]